MVNVEDILKHQLLGSLEEKYFKRQHQAYINYANRKLAVLIQHLYDDHGTISPMDIEESDKKMKQEWSLLEPMVELFEKNEEGDEFGETANIPIPGWKVVNISYLLVLRTGGTEKVCEQWEDMKVRLKIWQAFKDHLAQAYRRYLIRKKSIAAAYGYGASENHTQETEAQVNTSDTLQALCMCSNGRQGVNGEPHQHQPHIISEPNSSTRDNLGGFQTIAGTTSPYKNKNTSHKENINRSKNQG